MLVSGIVAGLLVGLLAGGDLRQLGQVRIRSWVAFVAAVGLRAIAAIPLGVETQRAVYLASLCLLVVVAGSNLALPGASAIAAGLMLNLLVISVNGGAMPVRGLAITTNGAAGEDPLHRPMEPTTVLPALGDVIPFLIGGLYSPGDVLLAVGLFYFLVRTLKRA